MPGGAAAAVLDDALVLILGLVFRALAWAPTVSASSVSWSSAVAPGAATTAAATPAAKAPARTALSSAARVDGDLVHPVATSAGISVPLVCRTASV